MSAKGNKTRLIKKASKKNKKNKKRKITRSQSGKLAKREIIHQILSVVLDIKIKTKYGNHNINAHMSQDQTEEYARELALAEDRCVEYLNDPKNFTQNITQIECEKKFRAHIVKFILVYYPDFPLMLEALLKLPPETVAVGHKIIPVDM